MKLQLRDARIKAAVVMKDGNIIAETEHADQLYPQYSITKSLLSLCIGFLLDAGRLALTSGLGEFVEMPVDAPLSAVTLEELLTMRSGLNAELLFADRRTCPDYLAACLHQKIGKKKGFYNNADAYLAGRMAEAAYGQPLEQLITERIFAPLGITEFAFESDPQGHFFGASGLQLSTRDLAKLGESVRTCTLYPRAYCEEATRAHSEIDGRAYGYFFWIGEVCCFMSGKQGQKCYIFPEERAVIALNSENADVHQAMQDTLLPLVRGDRHAV